MPLFPEVNTYYKGRTHTNLVVSEGNAPAVKYIPAAVENAAVKFQYEFGPEGNKNVVIPKGKAVAISGLEWDYETEKHIPALAIANGLTNDGGFNGDNIIGVNHHNVYERRRDRFSGNQPVIITRELIEVPFFTDQAMATAIQFGAGWAASADAILGKYVAVDENGNFTLANDTTYKSVIGQCYGVETDLPPAGFLQYFMEMSDDDFAQMLKDMSHAPSPGRTKDAEWNDVGTYPLGTSYLKSKQDLMKAWREGIPFLTDGYFRARTEATYALGDTGVTVNVSGAVTVNGDNTITCANVEGAALFVRLPDKFAVDALSEFSVSINSVQMTPNNFHIDHTNNTVVIYITEPLTSMPISIDAVVLQNQIPGIPTGWDFAGSMGAMKILLQK